MTQLYGITEEQRFPLLDVLRSERAGELDFSTWRPPRLDQRTRDWHSFINTTGGTIPAWAVMRITGSNAIGDWYEYTVAQPNTTFYREYLVNGSSDVENNARSCGTFLKNSEFVAYDDTSGTPADGEEWGPKNGQWTLVKTRPGFIISGGQNNLTGTKRTVARQKLVDNLLGRTTGNLTPGSSVGVALYVHDGTAWIDIGLRVTAWDFFLNSTDSVTSGSKVAIMFYIDRWVVIQAYCEVDDSESSAAPAPQQSTYSSAAGGNPNIGPMVLRRRR